MTIIRLISVLCLFVVQVNAQSVNEDKKKKIDLNNIAIDGLDKAVAEVFQQTRTIIEDARTQGHSDLEFSATKEWCLLLHNFEFLKQAKKCYFTVGLDDKKDAKWPYLYGKASLEQGEMADAKKGFEQSIKRDGSYLPAHYHLINMMIQDGELREAFEKKSQVPAELQLTSSMLKISGDLYFEVENYHVSIGFYQQALTLVEGAGRLHYKIARAYGQLGEQEKAEHHMALSNEAGVKLPDPYYQEVKSTTVGEVPYLIKAKAALVNGDLQQAIEGYQKALEYNPDSSTARLNIAVAYFQNKQVEKAESLFKEVLEQDSEQLTALYNLAIINKMRDDFGSSKRYLERFLLISPNDRSANINLAEIYYRQNLHEKVLAMAEIDQFKTDELIQKLKAQSLVQMQEYQQAIDLLENIHKHRPNNKDVPLMLVKLFAQVPDVSLRNTEKAVEYAQKAVAIEKDVVSMWQLLLVMDQAQRCGELPDLVNEMAQMLNIDDQEIMTKLQQQRGTEFKCVES